MAAALGKRAVQKSVLHLLRKQCRARPQLVALRTRSFLSEAYSCNDVWNQRLEDPIIQKLKDVNYAYELDRKFTSKKPVSAVDIDLFVNSVTDVESLEDLEDFIHRFRRTPSTINTFQSTHHAVVRAFLQYRSTDPLMRILNDRVNYGIFPDYYTCNMLMDTFIEEENFRDAAKIAIFMMLQEDFDHPISHALSVVSCLKYLQNAKPQPWDLDAENEVKEEDDGEEVLVRVRFVQEPFFDNHFDLTDPKKLIGKTLAYTGKEYPDVVGNTCQLIGWSMFEDWDRLQKFLEHVSASNGKQQILAEGLTQFEKIITEIPDDEAKTRETVEARFAPFIEKLKSTGCVKDGDLMELASAKVAAAVKEQEPKDIEHLKVLYKQWMDYRNKELDRQIFEYMKQEKIKEIKEKKKKLAEKEERLFFFENLEKHRLNIPPEEEDTLVNEEGIISKDSLLDVPPEIEGKVGRFSSGVIEQHEPWWRWKEVLEDKKKDDTSQSDGEKS